MTNTLKRSGAALVSLALLVLLALCAGAASSQNVGVMISCRVIESAFSK